MPATGELRVTPKAKADLFSIWRFIAPQNAPAADRLLRRLDENSRLLAANPGLGVARPDYGSDLRQWRYGNYVIVYRPIDGGIEVIRYLDGRRDLTRLFR